MTKNSEQPPRQSGREGGSGVQSIDRAVLILRCFGSRAPELGISDIARATDLSTSTAHRLLASLQHNGLVRQTAERRYVLGPLLVQLAGSGALPASLRDAAVETMRALRDRTDETVGLHELLSTNQRAVIDQAESHHALRRTYTELGLPIPLPHGAPGKAILAFVPRAVSDEVLAKPIEPATPSTITDPQELRVQLERVRADGFAMSFCERTPGIHTVAAPVFGGGSRVVGCMSISGPEVRMPRSRLEALSIDVKRASWQVSEVLGATREGVQRCVEHAAPSPLGG
ncbi:IclR family acetate operon transcriptional repressor [Lipingzhangella halophila]|uniref:Glycerol operon regulatory protein n=1 Tax=Lipingzhangella halophila TaxID=1783352 RepID=A0A7W7REM8_9ACTN|nr:IclR family transcriptional regulator [Lipingzhangella halophila]MBB4930425.1 IclR family acetate operon transcriptional repressor [Lipingzhangella halophila]